MSVFTLTWMSNDKNTTYIHTTTGDIASSAEALEVATRLQRIGAEKRAAHDRKRAEQRKLRELRKQVREQELVIAGLKATLESLDEEEAGLSEELALL